MLVLSFAVSAKADANFTNLVTFNNATYAYGGLVQAGDGNLYGVTQYGGANNLGSIYRLGTDGVYALVYSFVGSGDGANPYSRLVQAPDGNLYGTALTGGAHGYGSFFRFTTNGVFTRLYSFTGGFDGAQPVAPLTLGPDGAFYGTASLGGGSGYGAVFRVSTTGALTPLYSFSGTNDGAYPFGGLALGTDGNLYGTTAEGGTAGPASSGLGTLFRISLNGAFASLHAFSGGDGAYPYGDLTAGTDGNLYGTTAGAITNGGARVNLGTVFTINPADVFSLLHSFTGANDGLGPYAGVIEASDGTFYGTTTIGGNGYGTLFQITTAGAVTLLHVFNGGDGALPYAPLVQGLDGNLYGTTSIDGANGGGTVFRYTLSAPPFVVAQPVSQTSGTHGTATFSVLAGGTAPLTYSWLKNGANLTDGGNISGSTNSTLTVSSVSSADAGTYAVIVNNPFGTVTSSNAQLSVKLIRPTLSSLHPGSGARVSNPALQVTGKAKAGFGIGAVFYQDNGTNWNLATTANGWTNWTADVTLTPGPNVVRVYALDSVGNASLTNQLKYTYILSAPLVVQTTGFGTTSPKYDGKFLAVGKTYSMTARGSKGFAFTNWTGSVTAYTARLTFTMASNLTYTANFVDVGRPVVSILSPRANQKLSDAVFTATGKALDNVGVTSVYYQLNELGWTLAATANNWTNWTADLTLAPGVNVLQAFASDARGNLSRTNTVKVTYVSGGP
jgi:uncharacterized repeat protein (TIGR03803 family)